MASKTSYFRSALTEKANFVGLTLLGIGAMFAGTYWIPVLVGGAVLEAAYLLFMPESGPYRRLVDLRTYKEAEVARRQNSMKIGRRLPKRFRDRFEGLLATQTRIQKALEGEDSETASEMLTNDLSKLGYLIDSFVRFAELINSNERYLNNVKRNDLANDIKKLEIQINEAKEDRTKRIVEKNLGILQKRLERHDRIANNVESMNAQLDVIENTFQLVREQMMTMNSPHSVSDDLDEIISSVELTEDVVRETNELMDSETRRVLGSRRVRN